MPADGAEKMVCFSCVGEDYLKAKIEAEGVVANCSYCGGDRNCILLEELASIIEGAVERSYYMTSGSSYPGLVDTLK